MTNTSLGLSRRTLMGLGAGAVVTTVGLSACSGREPLPDPGTGGGGADVLEAPMLTEKIESGELPPLAERLPSNPFVQELGPDGPGQYGGTIRTSQNDALQAQLANMYASYGLMEWNLAGTDGVPSLAESVEANEDNSVFTITLREGLKWSDGEPLTIDDIEFAVKDVLQDKTLYPSAPLWIRNGDGSDVEVEKSGNSITITFKNSFALFVRYIQMPFQSHQMVKPKHYLKAFHPDHADQKKIEADAKKAGFDTWDQWFADNDNIWLNPDRPTAAAFVLKVSADGQTRTAEYERNPYYFKTDPDGRQLPYVDKIQGQLLDDETLNLRAAGGDLDFQGLSLSFTSTGLFQESAEAKGYEVLRWRPAATQMNIFPNLSHKDPETRKIFQELDFRAALSHAINREELNSQLLGGAGTVRQFCPQEGDAYYVEGTGERFLEYDLDKANALLDGLGLDKRDAAGTRLSPEGKPLDYVVVFVDALATVQVSACLQFVADAWAKIGIKLSLRAVDDTLYYQLLPANDFDMIQYSGHMLDWDMEPIWFTPSNSSFRTGPAFGEWCSSNGEKGVEPIQEIKDLWSFWQELAQAPTDEERIAAGQKISRQWDEKVYVLGLIDIPFRPVIVNKKLNNVQKEAILVYFHGFDGTTRPEQLHFSS